jgi:predicted AlkP superfamily phosphohydrolase/phosphomutase
LPSKVVFVGIDSADYSQIKRMCKNNELPNIKKFEDFFLGRMQAPIPPHTAASWTSMLSGTNPGKHGIFYFRDVQTDKIVSSSDVGVPYVWELLGAKNRRSIVLNVPLTYPIRKTNGIMISGVHADKADQRSVYPESLIPKVAKEYKFDLQGINLFYGFSKDPESTCSQLLDDEEARVSFFCKLLEANPWEFGCIVLTSLDRIQHHAWPMKSDSEPTSKLVSEAYRRMDKLVGKIIDLVADYQDCVTILASDHGFQDKSYTIYPNTILAKARLLAPKSLTDKFETRITEFGLNTVGSKIPKRLARLLIRIADSLTPLFPGLLSGSHRFDVPPIDYSRTKAYAYSYGLVVVNLKGRNIYGIVEQSEKDKIVSQVVQAFKTAQLSTGSNLLQLRTIRTDDYYSGSRMTKAPDLLIEPIEGCYFSCNIATEPCDDKTKGEHSTSAIIGAIGRGLNSTSQLESPNVWDVGASILELLGFKVPIEIDGKPLFASILTGEKGEGEEKSQSPTIVTYADLKSSSDASETAAFSEQEEELIASRLKDMGYE